MTWQTWDTLTGNSGIDTLFADMNANVVTMTNVSSVERINLNITGGAATVNAANAAYIQQITANDAAGLTINSLGSLPTVSLAGTGATTINFIASAFAPAGQTLSLTLAGKTAGAVTISDTGTNVLEGISIASTGGANTIGALTTSGIGSTTLTITGDQNFTMGGITDTNSTLRTINASAATGNITTGALLASSTFTGGIGDDSVTSSGGANNFSGGLGNDTFVMTTLLTSQDTIAGGGGTGDIISAATATLAAFTAAAPTTNISGIESLTLTTAAAGDALLLSAIQAGINDVNVTTAGAGQTGTITFDSGVAGNIDVGTAAAVATLGAFTVVSAGTGTADSITIDNDTTASNIFAGAITATGVETLTLDGTTTTTAIAQGGGAIALAASTGGTTTLILQGNNSFTPGAAITAGTINASALTMNLAGVQSALTMVVGANTATTITGSAGDDTLLDNNAAATAVSIHGGAGNDTITSTGQQNDTLRGGEGNDSITGATGNDDIDGGAGNDLITFATAELTANDTVNGGEGVSDVFSYTSFVAADDNVVAAQTQISNFEVLRMGTAAAGGVAVTMSNYINNTGFTQIQLATQGAGNGANGFSFGNVSSTLNTISAIGAVAGTQVFDRLTDTAADALTVRNATTGAGAASTITALTALDEETINITEVAATTAGANDLTITTLTVADLVTLNITSASDVVITQLAGDANLATVNASGATGAVTVSAESAGRAVTMTGNSSSTAVNTLTGGAFADAITGGGGADVLVGGGGADTIGGAGGADNITGGNGADRLTGGTGADTFVGTLTSSVATSASAFAGATLAAGDTLTFANGVDVITDFTAGAGGDILENGAAVVNAIATGIGENVTTGFDTATTSYFISGTWNGTVFTATANGVGADTAIVFGDAAPTALGASAAIVILVGVDSDNLIAANFS